MKEYPKNQLNPKVKNVWRINDAIWLTVCFLACFLLFFAIWQIDKASWSGIFALIVAGLYVVSMIVFLVVLPPIRFMRWRYELSEDYLDIARGIIWKRRIIIPFIRVQNTDTRQGPILRAFGLASVTVSTAAGAHEIPGLDIDTAEKVRDKAAEFARLAQEDL